MNHPTVLSIIANYSCQREVEICVGLIISNILVLQVKFRTQRLSGSIYIHELLPQY